MLKLQRDDDKLQKLDKCSRSKKDWDVRGQIVELQKIETTLAAERALLLQTASLDCLKNIKIAFILRLRMQLKLKQPFRLGLLQRHKTWTISGWQILITNMSTQAWSFASECYPF